MAVSVVVIGSVEFLANSIVSPAHNQAAGNCIVVATQIFGVGAKSTLNDTAGNTYVNVFADNGGAGVSAIAGVSCYTQIWYVKNCKGNANNIITVINAGLTFSFGTFYDVSGVDLVSPLDVAAKGTGTSNTAATSVFTTVNANEVAISIAGYNGGAGGASTPGAGYTLDGQETSFVGASQHEVFSSIQTGVAAQIGIHSSQTWQIVAATFAQLGGSGGDGMNGSGLLRLLGVK